MCARDDSDSATADCSSLAAGAARQLGGADLSSADLTGAAMAHCILEGARCDRGGGGREKGGREGKGSRREGKGVCGFSWEVLGVCVGGGCPEELSPFLAPKRYSPPAGKV